MKYHLSYTPQYNVYLSIEYSVFLNMSDTYAFKIPYLPDLTVQCIPGHIKGVCLLTYYIFLTLEYSVYLGMPGRCACLQTISSCP